MSNPFREALDADKSIGTKKSKKKPVVKDIVKILENEDAVDPDAVYTEEQLTDIASESDEAAASLRARLEDLRYEVETPSIWMARAVIRRWRRCFWRRSWVWI